MLEILIRFTPQQFLYLLNMTAPEQFVLQIIYLRYANQAAYFLTPAQSVHIFS